MCPPACASLSMQAPSLLLELLLLAAVVDAAAAPLRLSTMMHLPAQPRHLIPHTHTASSPHILQTNLSSASKHISNAAAAAYIIPFCQSESLYQAVGIAAGAWPSSCPNGSPASLLHFSTHTETSRSRAIPSPRTTLPSQHCHRSASPVPPAVLRVAAGWSVSYQSTARRHDVSSKQQSRLHSGR